MGISVKTSLNLWYNSHVYSEPEETSKSIYSFLSLSPMIQEIHHKDTQQVVIQPLLKILLTTVFDIFQDSLFHH